MIQNIRIKNSSNSNLKVAEIYTARGVSRYHIADIDNLAQALRDAAEQCQKKDMARGAAICQEAALFCDNPQNNYFIKRESR